MILRTTFRETFSSRQIALIGLPWTKNARRIFAIVSTISIPTSASMKHGSHCGPYAWGSRLDADHPQKGVLIPCRNSPYDRAATFRRFDAVWTAIKQANAECVFKVAN